MDGAWTESGRPRPIPNPEVDKAEGPRFHPIYNVNALRVCEECGCVVADTTVHRHAA